MLSPTEIRQQITSQIIEALTNGNLPPWRRPWSNDPNAPGLETRRPFFTQQMQETCLEVRRRNCGINGRPVLFYSRRLGTPMPIPKTTPQKNSHKYADLIEGLRALGLTTVKCSDVEAAIQKNFPNGKSGIDDETILRAVFLHLKRQNTSDNVG